jgi:hypothetical protein
MRPVRFACYYGPMSSLDEKAFGGLAILFVAMAALLFIAAGTFHYWQAWLLLAAYFAPSFAITVYLMKKDRYLRGG